MTIKPLPLKGLESYAAMHAYIKLLVGLKYLPAYLKLSLEEMFEVIEKMEPADRRKVVRQAALVVPLDQDELLALMRFAADANGAPYSRVNAKDLEPAQIMSIVTTVTDQFADLDPSFLSSTEKKN